jgi:hypothetical protein
MATKAPVQTPGLPPAPPAATTADDSATESDLAQFETDGLPPRDEVQLQLAEERAARRKLEKRLDAMDKAKADKPGRDRHPEPVSMEQAKAEAEAAVKEGRRPRMILTHEGWYCHPEMARVPGSGVRPVV